MDQGCVSQSVSDEPPPKPNVFALLKIMVLSFWGLSRAMVLYLRTFEDGRSNLCHERQTKEEDRTGRGKGKENAKERKGKGKEKQRKRKGKGKIK